MDKKFDFSGWATKANLKCSDGRVISPGAFKDMDGATVPLVWGHNHSDPMCVLGNAVLEHRDEGMYTYGTFNDTEQGRNAKTLVEHGDIVSLSICANKLEQDGDTVMHGIIREVSLVLAGANPGAFIDSVIMHGEESDEAIIYTGEELVLNHADEEKKEDEKMENSDIKEEKKDKTISEIFETLNDEQKNMVYAMVGMAAGEDNEDGDDADDEGGNSMKHNVFDKEENKDVLTHADQEDIIALAKSNNVGSLRTAMRIFAEERGDTLEHGITDIQTLFPEYKDVKPGAPELITRDQTWIDSVLGKAHKSPISRIRTRQADARGADIRGKGYQKGKQKGFIGNLTLLNRTTDPQTIYVKDKLERDDIIDITDFDVVDYQYRVMRMALNEELATAVMIGDGREPGDEQKIYETHVRPIWTDDELYTIHANVDIAAAKAELQGTNTAANFGDNYVYAEAIIAAALYARENYKGSGSLDFYCTPHLLNVMLLARDLNGRRIYESKSDLAAALNVNAIHTVEQFEGKTRTDGENGKKKLLGIFVNMADYQIGSTKGGQITNFEDFDIDFNQYKYLMETRVSGALTKIKSAIVLEEPVAAASEPSSP